MNRIPQFPESKKLTLEDKEEIETFVRKFPPYSDYNFTSLYCYNVNDKVEVSWLNGNLVVLFQDYISDEMFYSFLGTNLVAETALSLLKHSENLGLKNELRLIPECTIKCINGNTSVCFNEDRNNFDYILSVSEISECNGNKFRDKRGNVNKFKRKYPNHNIRILDLHDTNTKFQIHELCKILIDKKLVNNGNLHELAALERLLININYFNTICLSIFIQDKLTSFVINEQLNNDYVISHFEKSDISFKGITPFLFKELSKELKIKVVLITTMNRTWDLKDYEI